LPNIGDAGILFTFWENTVATAPTTTVDSASSKRNKPGDWHRLEKLGDTFLRTIINELLAEILGERNYTLSSLILNHANSNRFFEALTIHYGLQHRLKCPPSEDLEDWKYRADIFEAWVGAHISERQIYDKCDELLELRTFLHQLFLLRYRKLLTYLYNPSFNETCFPRDKITAPTVRPVGKDDSIVRGVFGTFLDVQQIARDIGHLVTISCKLGEDIVQHYAFNPSKKESSSMSKLQLWNRPRKSHTPFVFGLFDLQYMMGHIHN